ncbi:MAG: DUF364 domain-containing protein [Desulfobacterales bacterium]|nr:DUF364 domain-containing protein [Desulfobacterales bacterium]
MGILDRIYAAALPLAQGKTIADVRIGLGYTCVSLDDGGTGLGYTFRSGVEEGGCTVFHGLRPLAGQPAGKLLDLLRSGSFLERAVGLAAANALLNTEGQGYVDGDILDQTQISPGDTVSMVGHFKPLVGAIRKTGADLKIFERIDQPQGGLLPTKEAPDWLKRSALAVLTATTILNGTADSLIEAATGCPRVVILGPSTPLCGQIFAGTPVTGLSGVVVADADGVRRAVSEGGGTRAFMPFVRKVNLSVLA